MLSTWLAALGVSAWLEHIDTHANAADGGYRGSFAVAQALGITLLMSPVITGIKTLWQRDHWSEWPGWIIRSWIHVAVV